jgi:hypothetical protein
VEGPRIRYEKYRNEEVTCLEGRAERSRPRGSRAAEQFSLREGNRDGGELRLGAAKRVDPWCEPKET